MELLQQRSKICEQTEELEANGESQSEASCSASEDDEIEASVREDMCKLDEICQANHMHFRLIDRVGEGLHTHMIELDSPLTERAGTFSTVYKAEDMQYDFFENEWDTNSDHQTKCTSTTNPQKPRRPRYVAIKKIYVTSSPLRIQNELELLHVLRGHQSVCPLITAFRYQDQVVAILPYFVHQDFRVRAIRQ